MSASVYKNNLGATLGDKGTYRGGNKTEWVFAIEPFGFEVKKLNLKFLMMDRQK